MPPELPGGFSEATRRWFATAFPAGPTPAQRAAWPVIAGGDHTLLCAPTGSGKTLAAFLWALDRLTVEPPPDTDGPGGVRVLYLSPLRALAVDVDRNLRAPLRGLQVASGDDRSLRTPTVGIRTGDTPPAERRRQRRRPPDILITTPESLYLLLTSGAREMLTTVETVIVDEIHALVPTKRGAHLAVSLERLVELAGEFQRIGLSATQRPLEEVARFLGGRGPDGTPRPVSIVDTGGGGPLEVEVVVPVEDMGRLGEPFAGADGPAAAAPRRSIWPSLQPVVAGLIAAHTSTLVFTNNRRSAERLAHQLNELLAPPPTGDGSDGTPDTPAPEVVRAHHGSLSREQRLLIEDDLKAGRIRGLVATSSLELGIDMGAVDLVVQVGSPGSVARGLQRVGRSGHAVGAPSVGRIFPRHRLELLEAAVVAEGMLAGRVESTRYLRNPLDVLAQHIVSAAAVEDTDLDHLLGVIRRAAPFAELSDRVAHTVVDMLAGRYPSERFSGLRARISWDRAAGRIRARPGAQRIAVTNPGTIPDRGLFGVHLPDGTRVGELDEEMVYESRVGETFVLGATTWRIEDITPDRVIVTPAPGAPGKLPFWHGDGPGRPAELAASLGSFIRTTVAGLRARPDAAREALERRWHLDPLAAANVEAFLTEQAEATGAVPDDRTVVIERFTDELGDWRVCVLSVWGAPVHAPWGIAVRAGLRERLGVEPDVIWSDDGIVVRLPDAVDELPLEDLVPDPARVRDLVVSELGSTALFAARFREAAARALLLPRRRPDRRTPLWQQRQRAADLLAVAAGHPEFPITLEATRECLQDTFDLASLEQVLAGVARRMVRVVATDTDRPSPWARSLLFGWVAAFMYEGDAPLAERRAAALALDRGLLAELLGEGDLRELLDPVAVEEVVAELAAGLPGGRRPVDADDLWDLLRRRGPVPLADLADVPAEARAALVAGRRAFEMDLPTGRHLVADVDVAVVRDALGVPPPPGVPAGLLGPAADTAGATDALLSRWASTHGPFRPTDVAAALGLPHGEVEAALIRLEDAGTVVRGGFTPGGVGTEWCHVDVLRRLRRRSLAHLRRQIEPVDGAALARFSVAWHGLGDHRGGPGDLDDVLVALHGCALVASTLETDVLAARIDGYRPADLDARVSAGEIAWTGAGALGPRDGRIRLWVRADAAGMIPPPAPVDAGEVHDAIRAALSARGALFFTDLLVAVAEATGVPASRRGTTEVLAALWDLVWAGEVTADTLAPLRAAVAGPARSAHRTGRRHLRRGRTGPLTPPAAAGRWSLVSTLAPSEGVEPTAQRWAWAATLLDRHGVLTRETVLAEAVPGGFAALYPVLVAATEQGRVRRGYFVEGLGGAQFALPGAVDRIRTPPAGDKAAPVVVAATDPAQPYGSVLPWPETAGRPTRSAGALVVLVDGHPAAHLDGSGRRLSLFGAASDPRWADALAGVVRTGRRSRLEITHIDGEPAAAHPAAGLLRAAGFADGYRGLTLRS